MEATGEGECIAAATIVAQSLLIGGGFGLDGKDENRKDAFGRLKKSFSNSKLFGGAPGSEKKPAANGTIEGKANENIDLCW